MVALVQQARDSATYCFGQAVGACSQAGAKVQKVCSLMPEVHAVVTGMVPNAVVWYWRTRVVKTITHTSLQCTVNRVTYTAQLFYHGNEARGQKGHPLLFMHGDDGGDPSNTLHLIDRAVRAGKGPVYSLGITYRDANPQPHQKLLTVALDRISAANPDTEIIGIGYSHGCAELVHRVYIMEETRIRAIIAIAGRLKMTRDRGPKRDKEPLIRAIESAREARRTDFPLFQIGAGDRDWCMPPEASVVTPGRRSRKIADAMHINLVFHKDTLAAFDQFLNEAAAAT